MSAELEMNGIFYEFSVFIGLPSYTFFIPEKTPLGTVIVEVFLETVRPDPIHELQFSVVV